MCGLRGGQNNLRPALDCADRRSPEGSSRHPSRKCPNAASGRIRSQMILVIARVSAAFQFTNDHWQAYDLAMSALRPTCGSATLVRVNDMRGHSAVLALLDEALAAM